MLFVGKATENVVAKHHRSFLKTSPLRMLRLQAK
jgi:hypothetical protein